LESWLLKEERRRGKINVWIVVFSKREEQWRFLKSVSFWNVCCFIVQSACGGFFAMCERRRKDESGEKNVLNRGD